MSRRRRNASPFSLFAFQDIITSVTGIMILVTMILTLELLDRKESPQVNTDESIEQIKQVTDQIDAQIDAIKAQIEASSDELKFDAATLREQIAELAIARERMDSEVRKLRDESQQAQERSAQISQRERDQEHTQQTLTSLQDEIRKTREQRQRLKKSNTWVFNPTEGEQKAPWLVELDSGEITAAKLGENARPQKFASINEFLGWSSLRKREAEYFVLLVKPGGVESFSTADATLKARGFDVGVDVMPADHSAIDPETGAAF